MAALIPGLPIRVDAENQLVAKTVRFKGNDLEQARRMQAGLAGTKETAEQNKERRRQPCKHSRRR
jgi:hypothetical protein